MSKLKTIIVLLIMVLTLIAASFFLGQYEENGEKIFDTYEVKKWSTPFTTWKEKQQH